MLELSPRPAGPELSSGSEPVVLLAPAESMTPPLGVEHSQPAGPRAPLVMVALGAVVISVTALFVKDRSRG